MLDLDKYVNNALEIKVFGKKYNIMEPTMEMLMEIDKVETDLTKDNLHEKRLAVLELLINYNKEKRIFERSELVTLPFEAISRLIGALSLMRYEADNDPNLKSQSQKEK